MREHTTIVVILARLGLSLSQSVHSSVPICLSVPIVTGHLELNVLDITYIWHTACCSVKSLSRPRCPAACFKPSIRSLKHCSASSDIPVKS